MQIGIIGINHKQADLKLREVLAKVSEKRFQPGFSAHPNHPLILLSTCNRTEIYFSSEDLAITHSYILNILKQEIEEPFDQKLYSYFGYECFLHLAQVTSGLDSAILGETEIQKQVKLAYESTSGYVILPATLHYLFQKSLKIAKSVRTHFPLQESKCTLEHVIYQTGKIFFQEEGKPSILFIGASAINETSINFFHKKGVSNISLCNRTKRKTDAFSAKYNLTPLPWEDRLRWIEYDWIILGTKASHFLINLHHLYSSFQQEKLIIDLSVPRNADPELEIHPKISLFNIDQINQKVQLQRSTFLTNIEYAKSNVEQSVHQYFNLFLNKSRFKEKLYLSLKH